MFNNTPFPPNNGALKKIASIINAVISLAAEAKVGALFINTRLAIPTSILLE